jgi:hypothetical protein
LKLKDTKLKNGWATVFYQGEGRTIRNLKLRDHAIGFAKESEKNTKMVIRQINGSPDKDQKSVQIPINLEHYDSKKCAGSDTGIRTPAYMKWMSCRTLSARAGGLDPIAFVKNPVGKGEIKKGTKKSNKKTFQLKFGPNPNYWMVMVKNDGQRKKKNPYLAKLSKDLTDSRARFFIDKRTNTIRNEAEANFCLGNEVGAEFAQGKNAVFSKCGKKGKGSTYQKIALNARGVNMFESSHMYGMCLTTLMADPPKEMIQLSWYACAIPGGLAQTNDKDLNQIAEMQKFVPSYVGSVNLFQTTSMAVVQNKLARY